MTVSRGLRDEEPGLYAPEHLAAVLAQHPGIAHDRVPGFDHYTIVLSPTGGARTAAEIVRAIGAAV